MAPFKRDKSGGFVPLCNRLLIILLTERPVDHLCLTHGLVEAMRISITNHCINGDWRNCNECFQLPIVESQARLFALMLTILAS